MSKTVPLTQVVSAGLASTAAAFVTSRFGVAGTLLGAALTAMIITGGSAILRSYLENVPGKLRARRERLKAGRSVGPDTLQGRPDLRDNSAGRMRAAMGWFSQLPPLTRRSLLLRGLVAATVAFIIGIGTVYGAEKVIGNSLSCGLWSNCPKGAIPGVHLGDADGTSVTPAINLGRTRTNTTTTTPQNAPQDSNRRNPLKPQNPGAYQNPAGPLEMQHGLPQLDSRSRSEHNPSIPKSQQPVQPQTPQKTSVVPGEAPQKKRIIPGQGSAVKPGPSEQKPNEQNPPGGGASAPSQQGLPSGVGHQQPARVQ